MQIGITTTVPVEVIYASGCVPVDLNNVFITSQDPAGLVAQAEYDGYPRSTCAWIKGIYSVAVASELDALIAVVQGDCSQTQAMVETLQMRGLRVIPFAFPYARDRDVLRLEIEKLIERLGTTWQDSLAWKKRLDEIRRLVWRLDELSWTRGGVTGFENHYYQVCCSDFNSEPAAFLSQVEARLLRAESCPPREGGIRLGYVGIPPIFQGLHDYVESLGARIIFNEVARQFSMPFDTDDLVEQYALYTYPYNIFTRIEDIKREIQRREIAGLIHYAQSFCFRQIQDLILRKSVSVPILTLEGDTPMNLDARTRVRIESFVEMLS